VVSDDPDVAHPGARRTPARGHGDAEVLPKVGGIDVVVEATGAMEFGTRVMLAALETGRHVVSMNAEVDALLGHHLEAVAARSG
jgi:predicted homoserine dehydrogenase-like protein